MLNSEKASSDPELKMKIEEEIAKRDEKSKAEQKEQELRSKKNRKYYLALLFISILAISYCSYDMMGESKHYYNGSFNVPAMNDLESRNVVKYIYSDEVKSILENDFPVLQSDYSDKIGVKIKTRSNGVDAYSEIKLIFKVPNGEESHPDQALIVRKLHRLVLDYLNK